MEQVDPEVLAALPEEIREEVLGSLAASPSTSTSDFEKVGVFTMHSPLSTLHTTQCSTH